ncbi:MAG: hypothetical protein ACFCVD_17295 [Nodosilinea sp.]
MSQHSEFSFLRIVQLIVAASGLLLFAIGAFSEKEFLWFIAKYFTFLFAFSSIIFLPLLGLYLSVYSLSSREQEARRGLLFFVFLVIFILSIVVVLITINAVLLKAIQLSLEDRQRSSLLWYASGFFLSGSPTIWVSGNFKSFTSWLVKVLYSSIYITFLVYSGLIPGFIEKLSRIIAV